jgi:DNA-binding transcriptional LysR family regulator
LKIAWDSHSAKTLFLPQQCLKGIAEKMELRHLRYFVTVAELLNFTKAAAKLRVAQPSFSRQIRDLEEELGVSLLERNSRFVRLTEAGKAFATEARAVLQHAEAAARTARAFANSHHGHLHLGYAPSLTVEVLPQALRSFEKECPRVRVTIQDLSIREMTNGLREGRLDAALTVESEGQQPGLAFEKLRSYPVCVALGATHRLVRAKRIDLAELNDERLIVYSREEYPEYHEWLNGLFGRAIQRLLENAEEHDSGTSLIAAVEAGRGVAVVASVFSSVAGPRLKLRELHPSPAPLVVGVAYHRRRLGPQCLEKVRIQVDGAAETVLLVCVGHEGGKALVQPEMGPGDARDPVAPPLVREFVGLEPDVPGIVEQRFPVACAEQRELTRLLLDTAAGQHLRVGRPSIPHA